MAPFGEPGDDAVEMTRAPESVYEEEDPHLGPTACIVSGDYRRNGRVGDRILRVGDTSRSIVSMKTKLRAFDDQRAAMLLESDGLRWQYGSLAEYRRLKKAEAWGAPIHEWIDSFSPADVFFDIGANIGGFALRVAARGVPTVAIEPGADSFASLCQNARLNGLSLTALPVAIAEATGLEPFHYRTVGAGSALHALGVAVDHRGKRFTPVAVQHVIAYALDDVVEQFGLPPPTSIKIDVDGTEMRVLAGASRTLQSATQVLVELVEPRDVAIAAALVAAGYSCVRRIPHAEGTDIHDAIFAR
jgi:FkbM family methyltransferase